MLSFESSYKKDFKGSLFLSSLLHFLVDYLAVATLVKTSSGLDMDKVALLTLLYDFCAFALQPLFGVLDDFFHREEVFVLSSIMLIALGFFYPAPWAIILVGAGNALFHVYAGKSILEETKTSAPLGVFISTGTIGLTLALNYSLPILSYILVAMLVLLGLTYPFLRKKEKLLFKAKKEEEPAHKSSLLVFAFVCLGVLARAYLGGVNFGELTNRFLADLPALDLCLFVFAGKLVGGFILDAFGAIPLLSLSAIFSLLGLAGPNALLGRGIFLLGINLPMAFTLFYASKSLPKLKGFGFGVLASLLFVGVLLAKYSEPLGLGSLFAISVTLIASNLLLGIAVEVKWSKGDGK